MISTGYSATAIMRGMPYGTQLTAAVASGSPRLIAASSAARRVSYGFAYCGFNTIGLGGGGLSAGSAPLPARYGAHTPERSTCAYAWDEKATSKSEARVSLSPEPRALRPSPITAPLPGPDRCQARDRL